MYLGMLLKHEKITVGYQHQLVPKKNILGIHNCHTMCIFLNILFKNLHCNSIFMVQMTKGYSENSCSVIGIS